jgi:hypothetical protein
LAFLTILYGQVLVAVYVVALMPLPNQSFALEEQAKKRLP